MSDSFRTTYVDAAVQATPSLRGRTSVTSGYSLCGSDSFKSPSCQVSRSYSPKTHPSGQCTTPSLVYRDFPTLAVPGSEEGRPPRRRSLSLHAHRDADSSKNCLPFRVPLSLQQGLATLDPLRSVSMPEAANLPSCNVVHLPELLPDEGPSLISACSFLCERNRSSTSSHTSSSSSATYSSDSDSVEIIDHRSSSENSPLMFLRRSPREDILNVTYREDSEVDEEGMKSNQGCSSQVCFPCSGSKPFQVKIKVTDVTIGWLKWTNSPPRPIPALHGPLSLPYARCPSGAEGTLMTESSNAARIVWGLDDTSQEAASSYEQLEHCRYPSYTERRHRSTPLERFYDSRSNFATGDPNLAPQMQKKQIKPGIPHGDVHENKGRQISKDAIQPFVLNYNRSLQSRIPEIIDRPPAVGPIFHRDLAKEAPLSAIDHRRTSPITFLPPSSTRTGIKLKRHPYTALDVLPMSPFISNQENKPASSTPLMSSLSLPFHQNENLQVSHLPTPPLSTSPLWSPVFSPNPIRIGDANLTHAKHNHFDPQVSSILHSHYRQRAINAGQCALNLQGEMQQLVQDKLTQMRLSTAIVTGTIRFPPSPTTPPSYMPTIKFNNTYSPVSILQQRGSLYSPSALKDPSRSSCKKGSYSIGETRPSAHRHLKRNLASVPEEDAALLIPPDTPTSKTTMTTDAGISFDSRTSESFQQEPSAVTHDQPIRVNIPKPTMVQFTSTEKRRRNSKARNKSKSGTKPSLSIKAFEVPFQNNEIHDST